MTLHSAAAPRIKTLSLHDALPISDDSLQTRGEHDPDLFLPVRRELIDDAIDGRRRGGGVQRAEHEMPRLRRSEEHTSELQSQSNLVCHLLLVRKKPQPQRQPPAAV